MNIHQLAENLFVTGQISVDQIETLASQGYKTIICNRPDGESANQPQFSEIREAAEKHGISAHYLPVHHGGLREQDVIQFHAILKQQPGPALAYCRSGARSMSLWNHGNSLAA